MRGAPVPANILKEVLTSVVSKAPEIVGEIVQRLEGRGFTIDLGPMTPNARRHAAAVDRRVDEKIEQMTDEDTDPGR